MPEDEKKPQDLSSIYLGGKVEDVLFLVDWANEGVGLLVPGCTLSDGDVIEYCDDRWPVPRPVDNFTA